MTQETFRIDPERFKEANRDYIERIEKQGMLAVYDAALDTLFIEIGGPKEALSEHVIDNIMMRVEPDTLKVVGLEILDFLEDFVPSNRLVQEAIQGWGLERDADSQIALMEPQYKSVKEVVEALIPQFTAQIAVKSE